MLSFCVSRLLTAEYRVITAFVRILSVLNKGYFHHFQLHYFTNCISFDRWPFLTLSLSFFRFFCS